MRTIPLALLTLAIIAPYYVHGNARSTGNPDHEVEWTDYSLNGRIVNGTTAALRQFPYQVSLRRSYNSQHFCGGSLIHSNFVLTAAHCVVVDDITIQPWTVMVVGGELQLSKDTDIGQKRGVQKIYVHPQYDSSTLQNDITILALKVPFVLSQYLNVVPLASNSPVPNSICQVAGWGYPSEDVHQVTDTLMYVDLPLLSYSKCKTLLGDITDFPPGMLCAGYEEGQKDACQGDSGGGMICSGKLTGVVSGGNGCARPGYPGVYTDVAFFNDWISQNLKAPFKSVSATKQEE